MATLPKRPRSEAIAGSGDEPAAPAPADDAALVTLVELMFFAYRDFTGEPDAMLANYGLGRAHHRVLHFVNRHPGLRVADLLAILKITKQSLGRVLKPLIDDSWITSAPGADRRERRLETTPKGSKLAEDLATSQIERVRRALADDKLPPTSAERGALDPAEAAVRRFLFAMISADERKAVGSLIGKRADAES